MLQNFCAIRTGSVIVVAAVAEIAFLRIMVRRYTGAPSLDLRKSAHSLCKNAPRGLGQPSNVPGRRSQRTDFSCGAAAARRPHHDFAAPCGARGGHRGAAVLSHDNWLP